MNGGKGGDGGVHFLPTYRVGGFLGSVGRGKVHEADMMPLLLDAQNWTVDGGGRWF